jgi:hypothetical protein
MNSLIYSFIIVFHLAKYSFENKYQTLDQNVILVITVLLVKY